jgi:hypothetical protein
MLHRGERGRRAAPFGRMRDAAHRCEQLVNFCEWRIFRARRRRQERKKEGHDEGTSIEHREVA